MRIQRLASDRPRRTTALAIAAKTPCLHEFGAIQLNIHLPPDEAGRFSRKVRLLSFPCREFKINATEHDNTHPKCREYLRYCSANKTKEFSECIFEHDSACAQISSSVTRETMRCSIVEYIRRTLPAVGSGCSRFAASRARFATRRVDRRCSPAKRQRWLTLALLPLRECGK